MRGLKIVGLCVAGLVVLMAATLLAVSVFVNPNDFNAQIIAEVKASTGRERSLPGEIRLSVFPRIALDLGPLSLGNPEGFGTGQFLSMQHASLRVRLLPLLRKELQVGRIDIDGLDLRMKKNTVGKGNRQDFGKAAAHAEDTTPKRTGASGSSGSFKSLAGIRIKNSRIGYGTLIIANLNLELGNVAAGTVVPVQAGFELDTGPGGTKLGVTAALELTLDTAAQRLAMTTIVLGGELQQTPGHSLPWKFLASSLAVDLEAQTLNAPAFSAQVGLAQLTGGLAAERIVDAPTFNGSVKVAAMSLRDFLDQLGIEAPKIRDPNALSNLALSGDFAFGHNALRLGKLELQLDQSTLRGTVAITDLDAKAIDADLRVDHIDLDQYRSQGVAARSDSTIMQPRGC